MADKDKLKPEDIEKARKSIENAYENTIPTAQFGFQYTAEEAIAKTKAKIVNEKGMEGATKFLNSDEGKKYWQDLIQEETMKKAQEGLKDVEAWRINSLTANYLADAQRLAQGIGQSGAMYHAGEHLNVLEPNIQRDNYAQTLELTKFDESAIPGLMKSIGADKLFKTYDGMSKLNAARFVATTNKGGTPPGADMAKRLGLENLLHDKYKK